MLKRKSKLEVFLAFPNDPPELKACITRGIKNANSKSDQFTFRGWPENDVAGRPLSGPILSGIEKAPFIFADVTFLNFNVTYEIGFAIGAKKRAYLIRNEALRGDNIAAKVGVFDTLGYEKYEDSESLAALMTSEIDQTPLDIDFNLNQKAPAYLLETPFQGDEMRRIVSRVKKARLQYRSFNPSEGIRLAANEAIEHVASSHGVIIPLLSEAMCDAEIHNIRAAFLAGLACGMDKPTLILQSESGSSPLDIRDFSKTYQRLEDIDDHINDFAKDVFQSMQESEQIEIPPKGALASIRIGDPMAENEFQTLENYYLQRDEFVRTIRGEVNLVAGRKGTGKTALFSQVRNHLRQNRTTIVVDLKPEGYQLAKLKEDVLNYLTEGAKAHLVIAFWEYLLLLEVAYKLLEKDETWHKRDHNIYPHYIKLRESYRDSPNAIQGDFSERLMKLSSFVSQIYADQFGVRKEQRLTLDQITEILHAESLKDLKKNISDYLRHKEGVWILFDNLDKGWDVPGPTSNDILILRCLIDASRKIQRDMQREEHDFHCVVFVRNDVYQLLMNESSDFGKEMRVSLDWSDPEMLREMLRRRLVQNDFPHEAKFRSIWTTICVSHHRGDETSQYMIDRCLMRPRNLLKIFNHCKGAAVNFGRDQIESDDLEKGVATYSDDLLIEADQELTSIDTQAKNLIYRFIDEGWKFEREVLVILLEEHGLPQEKYDAVIEFLLYFGFFGIQFLGKDPVYIFDVGYDMKRLEMLINKHQDHVEFVLNPAFWPALGVNQ